MRNVSRALMLASAALATAVHGDPSAASSARFVQIDPSARGLQAPRHLRVLGMRQKPRHRSHARTHH